MGEITTTMKDTLIRIHGELPKNIEHEARACMINTLLGESFCGTFKHTYDYRSEALQFVKHLETTYDVPVVENKKEKYFMFNTNSMLIDSIYYGISAKLHYLE